MGGYNDIVDDEDSRPREWKDGRYPVSQETADHYLNRAPHHHQWQLFNKLSDEYRACFICECGKAKMVDYGFNY